MIFPSRLLSAVRSRRGALQVPRANRQICRGTLLAFVLLLFSAAGLPAAAQAATPAPAWSLDSLALPTNFSAADNARCLAAANPEDATNICDGYKVTAVDIGSLPMTDNGSADGSTVTLTDNLPAGLTVQNVIFKWHGSGAQAAGLQDQDLAPFGLCTTGPQVQCQLPTNDFGISPIASEDRLTMIILVTVDDPNSAGPLTNSVDVSGGGAPDVQASPQNTVNGADPAFGPAGFSDYIFGPDGRPSTQAAGHPYELTTRIDLNNAFKTSPDGFKDHTSVEDLRDIVVDLPLGFLGSAQAAPQCTFAQLASGPGCPTDTMVGTINAPNPTADGLNDRPIFNMVAESGVAAEFGYSDEIEGSHALYARVVPGPDGYLLQVTGPDAPQITLTDITTTFWGNPADPVHDAQRGGPGPGTPVAMFTNPSNCDGQPLTTAVHMDSWQHPGALNPDGTPDLTDPNSNWVSASSDSPPVTGCNLLHFDPTITVQPDSTSADSASGLDVEIKVPQTTDPAGLATPPLKKGVVTLPQGVSVNPAAADGLGACSPAQIDLASAAEPTCPDSSKVGTVQLQTPLIPGTLTGSIYLATQNDNPFNSLLAGYIVVDDPTTGVVIKIPGNLTPDPVTGQITGVFDNNPQFPFSDLKLHFKGGSRGVLATPESCSTYTTTSELTPWSAPDSGPAATPSDSFTIDSGPNGTPCVTDPAQRPLAPGFSAGTVSNGAGQFSPFVLKLTRSDGEQNLTGLDTTLPPGLLGKLAGIPECSDAALNSISQAEGTGVNEAQNPACPAGSQLGSSNVGAGAGTPFFVPGKVYLAGPYKGAPYSIAIVTPALAGPFDLGSIVVRAALYVDPQTAQITARSDQIPTIVHGIPLRIRDIRINLNRPNFTLNPTSCDPMAVTGTAFGSDGAQAALQSHFQAAGCGALPFAPRFSASILNGSQGIHRSDHPNLVFTLHGNPGDANVRMAQVLLPSSFQIDQANLGNICSETQLVQTRCAGRNTVGTATATTPLLDNPLSGPVYAVSGSGGLPKLAVILNGEVNLLLRGITTTSGAQLVNTFPTVPDAPVTDFSLTLNGGPIGYLVNNQNICAHTVKRHGHKRLVKTKLRISALIDAQNGKTADQSIPISAACGKAKAKKKSRHAKHKKH